MLHLHVRFCGYLAPVQDISGGLEAAAPAGHEEATVLLSTYLAQGLLLPHLKQV